MTVATDFVTLPTDFIVSTWKPRARHAMWSWADEILDLRSRGELHLLAAEILRDGGIKEPVLLGGDGRVWDGQRRILCAYTKGIRVIPCVFGFVG